MARETVLRSDKSGEQIEVNTGARIRIMFYDPERPDMRADLTDAEVAKLAREYKLKEVETRPQRRGEKRVRL